MSIQTRLTKLEATTIRDTMTVIIRQLSRGEDAPLIAYAIKGGGTIERQAGETDEAFKARAEAEARKAANCCLVVMQEQRGG